MPAVFSLSEEIRLVDTTGWVCPEPVKTVGSTFAPIFRASGLSKRLAQKYF